MEPIIAASNRTCRKNAAYNGIVNKELGRPAAGTVGLNSTTCLLSAIGLHCWYHQRHSLRRCGDVAGCQGAGARRSPYAAERRGGQGGFRGIVEERGMRVTLTEMARHAAGRVVYLYLPYWLVEQQMSCIKPSADVLDQVPALPARCKGVLEQLPRHATPPNTMGSLEAYLFSERWDLVLAVRRGQEGFADLVSQLYDAGQREQPRQDIVAVRGSRRSQERTAASSVRRPKRALTIATIHHCWSRASALGLEQESFHLLLI
ncbi:hypothetical protein BDZ90DRAFT_233393, partial [Jaminaea rosea]